MGKTPKRGTQGQLLFACYFLFSSITKNSAVRAAMTTAITMIVVDDDDELLATLGDEELGKVAERGLVLANLKRRRKRHLLTALREE